MTEPVLIGITVGLPEAGIPLDVFNPQAPLAGCRLCGTVFQTKYHRQLFNLRRNNLPHGELLQKVLDLNGEWRRKHTLRKHSVAEVALFAKTGFAFSPEAANKLAPFGIVPLGNMHEDIVAGMLEANRAPDLNKLEY